MRIPLGFLRRQLYRLLINVLVLPFQSVCLSFHCLAWMHWLEPPASCGIKVVRVDICAPRFSEKSIQSFNIKYVRYMINYILMYNIRFFVDTLLGWRTSSLFSFFYSHLSWTVLNFVNCFIFISWYNHGIFFSSLACCYGGLHWLISKY